MTRHFAFIAILGQTNVGKSTLINRFIGQKVSIISPKVQTTRNRVRGILTEKDTQLVLVDTPGIFKPKRRLDRAMIESAWNESEEADKIMMLLDGERGLTDIDLEIIKKARTKITLVVNKVDLVKKDQMLPLLEEINHLKEVEQVFCVSAKTGEGIKDLKEHLLKLAPEAEWMFPDDELTDLPDRLFCAEITREKLFLYLRQELPYQLTVEPVAFKETNQSIRIEQNIIVAKEAHKSIVLGVKGNMIKKIGESARKEMTKQLNKKVNLFLFVKVRENWIDDINQYKTWGLNFNA